MKRAVKRKLQGIVDYQFVDRAEADAILDSDARQAAELRRKNKVLRIALRALDRKKGRKWTPDLPTVRLALVVALKPARRKPKGEKQEPGEADKNPWSTHGRWKG